MKICECKVNCEFLQMKKTGNFGRHRRYRCMSEKAPEKRTQNRTDLVSGYLISALKKCPEGFVEAEG